MNHSFAVQLSSVQQRLWAQQFIGTADTSSLLLPVMLPSLRALAPSVILAKREVCLLFIYMYVRIHFMFYNNVN